MLRAGKLEGWDRGLIRPVLSVSISTSPDQKSGCKCDVMVTKKRRTYVGFGFGPTQAGLFLHEAYVSQAFRRMVVAEVIPERVKAIRRAHGTYSINVAHADRIETV